MELLSEFAELAPPGIDQVSLGYTLMEQIDTLRQIKGLESSICNDNIDNFRLERDNFNGIGRG